MRHLHQYGTECLIVDDAHDLSLEHLMLLKEVTDQGRLQYDHPLGLCLVAAGRGNTIPLKKTTSAPTEPVNQTLSPLLSPDAQGGVQSNKKQAPQSTKCTFSGIVPIDLKRFQESGVS